MPLVLLTATAAPAYVGYGGAAASELHSAYLVSKARCKHGPAGVLLHLHEAADPEAYRRELELYASPEQGADANVFAHVHRLQRAVSMRVIHPDTLQHALRHPHTRRIEACGALRG